MKKKLSAMSADNNRLKANLNQLDGKDKQQRMKIDEIGQQMSESMEKLRQANKEKVNWFSLKSWALIINQYLMIYNGISQDQTLSSNILFFSFFLRL